MKKILLPVFLIIILQSCSIFNFNNCKKYHTDSNAYRAYSEAASTNSHLAEEKALLLAKKAITEDIDNHIIDKCNHKTFLSDTEYENKLSTARSVILSNIEIICSKTVKKRETYISYIVIEISREDIDKEISNRLKQ
jgi:hypothetical protein